MTVKLIGLNGKARSGKDTTADFIQAWCEDYNLTSAREAFARRLKESAAHALGIFEDEVEFCNMLKGDYERCTIQVRMATKATGPNHVVAQITGREFLQYYGTEAHRDVFADDFWVDAVLPLGEGKYRRVFETKTETDGEGNEVASQGGAYGIPNWHSNFVTDRGHVAQYCLITDCRFPNEAQRIKELGGQVWKVVRDGAGAGDHASEQELDGELIDLVIDNNSTLADLETTVATAMEDISGLTSAEEKAINA